jgi:hypothetical protein
MNSNVLKDQSSGMKFNKTLSGSSMPKIQSSMDILTRHLQNNPAMPTRAEEKQNFCLYWKKRIVYLVNVFIHSPTYGFVLDVIIFIVTFIAFSLQVMGLNCYASSSEIVETISADDPISCTRSYVTTIMVSEIICHILFSLDLIFRTITIKGYLFDLYGGFLDILTVGAFFLQTSLYGLEAKTHCRSVTCFSLRILITFDLLRMLRTARLLKVLHYFLNSITAKVVDIIVFMATLICLSARLMYAIEEELSLEKGLQTGNDFVDYLYFIVTTISTVGYGDISPDTTIGRVTISICIFIFISVTSYKINLLVTLMNSTSKYKRPYHSVNIIPHIIVTGELDYESVNRFLGEYFHPDHVNKLGFSRLSDIVLVSKLPPTSEMESLMNRRQYGSGTKIRYVQASITTRSGMTLCDAATAGACIVLSTKICPSKQRSARDEAAVALLLACKAHRPELDVFIQIHKLPNRGVCLHNDASIAMSLEELRTRTIVLSCYAPGASTLIENLFTSFTAPVMPPDTPLWAQEFMHGCDMEVYLVDYPSVFEGKSFLNAAAALFDVMGNDVLLIGIAQHEDDIRLMPKYSYTIPVRTRSKNKAQSHRKYNEAFVILAPDETIASRMETDAEKLAQKLGQSIRKHKRSSLAIENSELQEIIRDGNGSLDADGFVDAMIKDVEEDSNINDNKNASLTYNAASKSKIVIEMKTQNGSQKNHDSKQDPSQVKASDLQLEGSSVVENTDDEMDSGAKQKVSMRRNMPGTSEGQIIAPMNKSISFATEFRNHVVVCNAPIETVIDIALTFLHAGLPSQETVHTNANSSLNRKHAATAVTRHIDTNASTLTRLCESDTTLVEETLKPAKNVVNVLAVGSVGTSNLIWKTPIWIPINLFFLKPIIGSKNTTGMKGVSMDDFIRSNVNDAWRAIIVEEDAASENASSEQENEGLQGVDTSVLMAYVNLEMSLHRCRKALGITSKEKHYVDDTPVVLIESSSELGMKIIASQRELRSSNVIDEHRNYRQSIIGSASPFNFMSMFQGANEWEGGHHHRKTYSDNEGKQGCNNIVSDFLKNIKVYTQTRRYVRTTAFASGLVFSDSYSDAALCMSMRSQARHSGSLIEVLDAFLGMTPSTSGGRDAHLMEQRLLLCEIEERFIGLNYSFLFMHSVLTQHILPIGLYRSPKKVDPHFIGSSNIPPPNLPYVYTNPHPDTTINAGDRVYILKPEVDREDAVRRSLSSNVHTHMGYLRHKSHGGTTANWQDISREVYLSELKSSVQRLQREMLI